jgi:vacuolar-type H+-ATPase subunit F/Vma7
MADLDNAKMLNDKIAVIGDELLTRGMSLGGVKYIYRVTTPEEVEHAIKDATERSEIGMIIINEGLAKKVRDRKMQNMMDSSISPVFVLVPAYNEKEEYVDVLRRLIIRAIGMDISAK